MVKINKEELEKMSKSKYGKYQPSQPNPYLAWLEKYFLRSTPVHSYINGAITIGVLSYWWFTRNSLPLTIWIIFIVLQNIIALIYWSSEKKRLDKEIARCGTELNEIQKEIKERKAYFDNIREDIEKNSKN